MAATLTTDGELTRFSFPIEKVEETGDGGVIVYGKATDGSVDSDEQIVDPDWSAKALRDWFDSGPNLRVMHDPHQVAGSGMKVEIDRDGDGAHWVRGVVDHPVAAMMVRKGHLRAYSVGIARPKIQRDASGKARGGIIKGGELAEVSLVDRPANRNCGVVLVKREKNGAAAWAQEVFGDAELIKSLEKSVGVTPVVTNGVDVTTVSIPNDVSVAFSPGDLAKLLAHRETAEKRVASGELAVKDGLSTDERDALPDKHFAYIDSNGDRHLPIHDEGHVRAAMGRFNQQQFETGDAKHAAARKIIARARGMGIDVDKDSNVSQAAKDALAELLKAASDGDGNDGGDCDTCGGSGKILDGHRDCPDCDGKSTEKSKTSSDDSDASDDGDDSDDDDSSGNDGDDDSHGDDSDDGDDQATKMAGGQQPYHRDADETVQCPSCDKYNSNDARFCDQCGESLPTSAFKARKPKVACPKCALKTRKPGKFCAGCGAKMDGGDAVKGVKPVPGEGVVGAGAAAIQPVPEHREPDGGAIEAFEQDAGLPTVPDASVKGLELATAMRLKGLGIPTDAAQLHDLLCPAFDEHVVKAAHPGFELPDLDVAAWQQRAMDTVMSAPLDEASKASRLWQHATTLRDAPGEIVAELRAEARKAFSDANPGPGTYPTPGELTPGRFKRPYVSDGRARPSTGQDAPRTAAVPSGQLSATQFTDGYDAAGRAAQSPSAGPSQTGVSVPSTPGQPTRTYYTNAMKDNARQAMSAMHDHIAQTFPDLCPMAPNAPAGTPANVGAVPAAAGKAEGATRGADELHALVMKGELSVDQARAELGLAPWGLDVTTRPRPWPSEKAVRVALLDENPGPIEKATRAVTTPATVGKAASLDLAAVPDLVKSAVASAVSPLVDEVAGLRKSLKAERRHVAQLQKVVDALADLPDPRTTPWQGGPLERVAGGVTKTANGAPAAARSIAESAARTQLMMMRELEAQARTNPDPAQREVAWTALAKMQGVELP